MNMMSISLPGPRAAPPAQQLHPALRHRASHDGFGNPGHAAQRQSWAGYNAPPVMLDPFSSGSGSTHIGGGGFRRPSPQQLAQQQHGGWGAPPANVPRGHYRNRSLGNRQVYPGQPQYRILHSYNSPAYRGAPIWG